MPGIAAQQKNSLDRQRRYKESDPVIFRAHMTKKREKGA